MLNAKPFNYVRYNIYILMNLSNVLKTPIKKKNILVDKLNFFLSNLYSIVL